MSISLRPYTYFMRSNVNLGSFGVTGVKRLFSAKMLLLLQNTWCYLYVTQCIYVAHKYAFTWDSLLHSMVQGQLEITSSGRVRHLWWQMCLVLLSSHNLLLLPHASCDFDQTWSEWPVGEWLQKLSTVWPQRSCRGHRGQKGHFYGKCYSSYMLNWILTKFGQKHQWVSGYKSYQQFDLKGHVEVTGVKKVIYFSKCSDWAEILIQWSLWHSKHPKNILKFIRGH